jgi:6-phosphogluconolactonase
MYRRDLLRGAAAFAALPRCARSAAKPYLVYWGTYTSQDPRYGGGAGSKGVYVSRFDSETGKLSAPQLAATSSNPSYLVVHPNRRYLYTVNEEIDHTGKAFGEVSAFSLNEKSGELAPLNRVSSKGGMPCHICVDKTGSVVAVANWATASTVTFSVRSDGSLGEAAAFYQHTGAAPGVQAHCHCVNVTPDNRYLIATDTGLNKVFVHRLNTKDATFTPHDPPFLALKHQANPRQLVFHPNGKWAYIANENSSGCTMIRYDSRSGTFEEGTVARTVPETVKERVTPAEVMMHPTGRFVFVSNRGHNSIAVLRIGDGGAHTLVDAFQPGGNGPRSFTIDPTGTFLLAMMQRSNAVYPLRIDSQTGKLTPAGDVLELPAPVCAKFVAL